MQAIRNISRLTYLVYLLAKHNASGFLKVLRMPTLFVKTLALFEDKHCKTSMGQRLANFAVAAGPTFIKVGQALSTRTDLIGPDIAGELVHLRDQLPAFSAETARATIEVELGSTIQELFTSFDNNPVAAASIAQVHFAITIAGDDVAIKVLRPGIEKAFSRDIALLRWLARVAVRLRPAWQRLRLSDAVELFAEMVRTEMDLRLEGAAGSELRQNFLNDTTYKVPKVFWQYTSKRILTTSRVTGIPIDQVASSETILPNASAAMFKQIFRDGFFHGDPHPGNLLVDNNGAINAVDFGIMGRLDIQSRLYIAETLLSIFTRDFARAAQLHLDAGYVPKHTSVGAFSLALRAIAEPILDSPTDQVSVGRLLGHLFHVTETFGMETQPHLLLLQKVVVIAEGTARTINPSLDIWEVAQPLIKDWLKVRNSPERQISEASASLQRLVLYGPQLLTKLENKITDTAKPTRSDQNSSRTPNQNSLIWLTLAITWVIMLFALIR